MLNQKRSIAWLALAYSNGERIEGEEWDRLNAWFDLDPANRKLIDQLRDGKWLWEKLAEYERIRIESVKGNVMAAIDAFEVKDNIELPVSGAHRFSWIWNRYRGYGIAALGVAFLVTAGWFYWRSRAAVEEPSYQIARLRLSNGKTVMLDYAPDGLLARDGKHVVVRKDHNNLYYVSNNADESDNVYHTLSTMRSGEYDVYLPDGSRIRLNDYSSIQYPVSSNVAARQTELTGGGYFQVKGDKSRPFVVKVRNTVVSALGTRFIITTSAQEDTTRISLLEGSLHVATPMQVRDMRGVRQVIITANHILDTDVKDSLAYIEDWERHRVLVYRSDSLARVLTDLAAYYHVIIYNPEHLRGISVFADLDMHDSLGAHVETINEVEAGVIRLDHIGDSLIVSRAR